jgi:hypothetical protein
VEATVVGRDGLVMGWTGAEEVAEFVVALTERRRRSDALSSTFRILSAGASGHGPEDILVSNEL